MAFKYEELDVYQLALTFDKEIFNLTKVFPTTENYGITSQLRRASASISLNISEGSNKSKKQFCHYLDISRGSILECVSLLSLCLGREYITQEKHNKLYNDCQAMSKMISGLKKSILKSPNTEQ